MSASAMQGGHNNVINGLSFQSLSVMLQWPILSIPRSVTWSIV